MAYDEITVQLPVQEATQSAEVSVITKQTVTPANGIKIKKALDNKNNSLVIIVEPTTAGAVTIKAGDNYPNRALGDLVITPTNNKVNAIILEDISRFENRDGSVCIAFASSFAGTIYAVAKRAGLKPVV
jgi:hypothetical protein